MLDVKPVTTYEALSLLISVGGFLAVVVSLRTLSRQIRLGAFEPMVNRMLDLDRVFIEHPELREYFYEGRTRGDAEPLAPRLDAVAEYLLDLFDSYLLQIEYAQPIHPPNWWLAFMDDLLASSPTLRDYLRRRRSWYSARILARLELAEVRRVQA